jgi:hypothetical protein
MLRAARSLELSWIVGIGIIFLSEYYVRFLCCVSSNLACCNPDNIHRDGLRIPGNYANHRLGQGAGSQGRARVRFQGSWRGSQGRPQLRRAPGDRGFLVVLIAYFSRGFGGCTGRALSRFSATSFPVALWACVGCGWDSLQGYVGALLHQFSIVDCAAETPRDGCFVGAGTH